jgi:hypothetical protein
MDPGQGDVVDHSQFDQQYRAKILKSHYD